MSTTAPKPSSRASALSTHWPVLLVWSCLLLLPAGRLVELPVAVMSVLAGRLWYRRELQPTAARYRWFSYAFLLFWMPMVLSLADALEPADATRVTLLYLRFYFAGLFIIWAIRDTDALKLLQRMIAWLLLFWALDAIIQFISGYDLFGYPYITQRLNGLFGRHIRLGLVLSLTAPFLIAWARTTQYRRLAGLSLLLIGFVVIASGTRAAWIMLALVLTGYLIIYLHDHRKRAVRLSVILLAGIIISGYAAYRYVPSIGKRIDQTLLLFSGDRALMDKALSYRLSIWESAAGMLRDHPLNGVGVRDFRSAYDRYAPTGDFYTERGMTPLHPHQYLLEIGAESGGIGLAGLALLYGIFIYRWRTARREQRLLARPALIALIALWFPLNTHLAFYSSFMGQVAWWITALYFAFLSIPPTQKPRGRPAWPGHTP